MPNEKTPKRGEEQTGSLAASSIFGAGYCQHRPGLFSQTLPESPLDKGRYNSFTSTTEANTLLAAAPCEPGQRTA